MLQIKNLFATAALAVAASTAFTAAAFESEHLYLTGGATPVGWTDTNPIEMTKTSEGNFTWSGPLYNNGKGETKDDGCAFKFLCEKSYSSTNIQAPANADFIRPFSDYHSEVIKGGDDNKWYVASNGFYTINVYPADEKIEIFPTFAIVGSACVSGWNCDQPLALTGLGNGVYQFKGNLIGGEFKFLQFPSNWEPAIFAPEANTEFKGNFSSTIEHRNTDGKDNKWRVTEAGNYTITVTLSDINTITSTRNGEGFDRPLYVIGEANGWNWEPLTPEPDGIYVWETDVTHTTGNQAFKFAIGKGGNGTNNWDYWALPDYIIPADKADGEDENTYTEFADGVQKSIRLSSEYLGGKLIGDRYWGVQEGHDGTYRFTLDPNNSTLSVKKITKANLALFGEETKVVNWVKNVADDETVNHKITISDGTSEFCSEDAFSKGAVAVSIAKAEGAEFLNPEGHPDYKTFDKNANGMLTRLQENDSYFYDGEEAKEGYFWAELSDNKTLEVTVPCSGRYTITLATVSDDFTNETKTGTLEVYPDTKSFHINWNKGTSEGIYVDTELAKKDEATGVWDKYAINNAIFGVDAMFCEVRYNINELASNEPAENDTEAYAPRRAPESDYADWTKYPAFLDSSKKEGIDLSKANTIDVAVIKNGVASESASFTVSRNNEVAVAAIEAVGEGETVYYNLQGVRVANPAGGIFLKVQNGNATKVLLP